jgi:putative hydrolase of the HAD superfamily
MDSNIKGIIFDYGGTLDSGGCHWGKVLWHAYERAQVPVTEQEFRDAYVYAERTLGKQPIIQSNYTFRQTLAAKLRIELEYLASRGILAATEPYHALLLDDVYRQAQAHTAHSRSVLEQLHTRYPMVLVSNFYGNIGVVLDEFGLSDFFQHVVESAVVGVRKPDSRIFELGVAALQLPASEVLVVGDSIDKDILPARKAGCRTAWLKGEGWTDTPADEQAAHRVITDVAELLQ